MSFPGKSLRFLFDFEKFGAYRDSSKDAEFAYIVIFTAFLFYFIEVMYTTISQNISLTDFTRVDAISGWIISKNAAEISAERTTVPSHTTAYQRIWQKKTT